VTGSSRWLAAGAALGLLITLAGLLRPAPSGRVDLGPDVVATVDGRPILRADFDRAYTALRTDTDGRMDPDVAAHRVLDRLIDEELLVQHGARLGLHERDPRARADLVAAALRLITLEAEEQTEGDDTATLRAFWEAHPGLFRAAPRVRAARWFFATRRADDADARRRADRFVADLQRGATPDPTLPDPAPSPLPDAMLPAPKLRDYLGPTTSAALERLAVGELSAPIATSGGYNVVRVLELAPGTLPPFEASLDEVREAWRRRRGEDALRDFLAARRQDTTIEVTEGLDRP